MMNKDLIAQVIASFQPGAGQRIEKLDKEAEAYRKAKEVETLFTEGVEVLRALFPNERVRGLAQAIWDVFHHRRVVLAMGPEVPTLTFAAFGSAKGLQGIAFAPHNWAEIVREDPLMQLGAVVMVGSQAVDFYNGRLLTDSRATFGQRAMAYEAEYLRTLALDAPNPYQKKVLTEHPTWDPAFEYDRKPVEPMQ